MQQSATAQDESSSKRWFLYSSTSFTFSHCPFKFSFHRLTLLSPPLTARILPLKLQLTRHNTASNSSVVLVHCVGLLGSVVQMRTVLSCEAEAMYDLDKMLGDHATSRTQSVWPSSVSTRLYVLASGLKESLAQYQP